MEGGDGWRDIAADENTSDCEGRGDTGKTVSIPCNSTNSETSRCKTPQKRKKFGGSARCLANVECIVPPFRAAPKTRGVRKNYHYRQISCSCGAWKQKRGSIGENCIPPSEVIGAADGWPKGAQVTSRREVRRSGARSRSSKGKRERSARACGACVRAEQRSRTRVQTKAREKRAGKETRGRSGAERSSCACEGETCRGRLVSK